MSEEQRVFNGVQLQEKNIEPSSENQPWLNRNFQLGNVEARDFKMMAHRMQRGIDFGSFPHDQGGFLSEHYGLELIKKNEALLVMTGSIKGFVRDINQTQKTDQKLEQRSRGMLSGMFGK